MKAIIWTRPDGGVSVTYPVRNTVGETLVTDDEIEQRALRLISRRSPANPVFVDVAAIPTDRTFRGAWKQNGSAIEHDMVKCRDLWRDHLRRLRKPKLEALDQAYLRADEVSDAQEKQRIAGEKQKLRDVTADPAIEAAQTPEQLKRVMPAILS